MSFGAAQRLRFMETIASSGLPMERVIVGTGAASIADAVRLTRGAFEYGFAAALVLPPFFLRDASDDGILTFYDALITRTNPPRRGLLLYNFPRMSGVSFRPPLVARLLQHFPESIAGMKDSSNDPQLQSALLRANPDFVRSSGIRERPARRDRPRRGRMYLRQRRPLAGARPGGLQRRRRGASWRTHATARRARRSAVCAGTPPSRRVTSGKSPRGRARCRPKFPLTADEAEFL